MLFWDIVAAQQRKAAIRGKPSTPPRHLVYQRNCNEDKDETGATYFLSVLYPDGKDTSTRKPLPCDRKPMNTWTRQAQQQIPKPHKHASLAFLLHYTPQLKLSSYHVGTRIQTRNFRTRVNR